MSVAYTLYITEPKSRNLGEKIDPEETEWLRLEDAHKIDYAIRALAEDLIDLLPPGYTIQTVKETP